MFVQCSSLYLKLHLKDIFIMQSIRKTILLQSATEHGWQMYCLSFKIGTVICAFDISLPVFRKYKRKTNTFIMF